MPWLEKSSNSIWSGYNISWQCFLETTSECGGFNNIKSLRNSGMGLRIQMSDDNKEYGQYSVLGHMLQKNTILNTDLIAGSVAYRTESI